MAKPAVAIGLFLAAWGASTLYLAATGSDWIFPIVSLILFGTLLPALAWVLTRRSAPPELPVPNVRRETWALLAYLVIYAGLFLGASFTWLRTAIPEGATQDLVVLGYKLLIHVLLPTLVLLWAGARIAPMWRGGVKERGFWPTLVVLAAILTALQALVSPSLSQIGGLNLPAAAAFAWIMASFAWLSIEAGLCEEYLFRAGLQTRLERALGSALAGILLTSVIFALAHAPGLYLRATADTPGASGDPIAAAAYTVAALAPISILFGVLWARTRSLLLVVLLHGTVDALPNTAELVRHWS